MCPWSLNTTRVEWGTLDRTSSCCAVIHPSWPLPIVKCWKQRLLFGMELPYPCLPASISSSGQKAADEWSVSVWELKQFVLGFCLIYFHNYKQEWGLKSEALKSWENFHLWCLCEIMASVAWNWAQFDGKGRNEGKVKWAFLRESTNMLQKSWWTLLNLQFTPKWVDFNSLSKPIWHSFQVLQGIQIAQAFVVLPN